MPDDEKTPTVSTEAAAPVEEIPQKESEKPYVDEDGEDNPFEIIDVFATPSEEPAVVPPVETPVTPVSAKPEITTPSSEGTVVAPAVVPEVSPTPQTPQGAAPVAQGTPPVTPAAPTPVAAPGVEPQSAAEDDPFQRLERAIETGKEKVIDAVALGAYQLKQEELDALATEPEKVVPTLLARVHVNAVQGVLRQLTAGLPNMVGALLQAREENAKRAETFWNAWPQLDKVKHADDVRQAAMMFRQMHPTATTEELIKHVGAQVIVARGLLNTVAPAAPKPPTAAVVPFTPAGAGQGSAPVKPVESGGWDLIAQAFQDD